MVIDVKQTVSEKKNEFEIFYDDELIYKAKLPFINITGSLSFEKLREIKVFDLNNNLKYKTEYNYIKNRIEEFIPLKYLFTSSQRFNQFVFSNDGTEFEIFVEQTELFLSSIIVKVKNEIYNCYGTSDGYINHLSIYYNGKQIGELLKPNVIIDGKDTYRIYLKDDYNRLADMFSMLALYLDRLAYNSSYIIYKGQEISYKKTYSKANKYYDKNWVINNFNSKEYLDNINKQALEIKQKVKYNLKKTLSIMGIGFGIILLIVAIVLIIVL